MFETNSPYQSVLSKYNMVVLKTVTVLIEEKMGLKIKQTNLFLVSKTSSNAWIVPIIFRFYKLIVFIVSLISEHISSIGLFRYIIYHNLSLFKTIAYLKTNLKLNKSWKTNGFLTTYMHVGIVIRNNAAIMQEKGRTD